MLGNASYSKPNVKHVVPTSFLVSLQPLLLTSSIYLPYSIEFTERELNQRSDPCLSFRRPTNRKLESNCPLLNCMC